MIHDSTDHFDVIIIGAGINGAGIARDASMRGLKVLLLDKGDVAGGTSSWSTRLIHGGLRYLEYAELQLVRESLRERETLMRIAPHLVCPIPILIPIYEGARRGRLIIRAGMFTYDLLSFDRTLPRHKMLSRGEALQRLPALNPKGLLGGALYYDCQVEFAERLVFENVLSAKEHGAKVLTYARVTAVDNGSVTFIKGESQEKASSEVVINAGGPWVDLINSGLRAPRLIGGTKGSHIVVRPFSGAPSTAIYIEAETDRRPFFVIPWNNNILIGTTEVRFEGEPDEVTSESWEIDYLLKETNRVFPAASLQREHVCYTYSGVRPLAFTTKSDEHSISRRHFVRAHSQMKNYFSVVGGKLTTFRGLAEECVDLIFKKLGKHSPACLTSEVPLPGASELARIKTTIASGAQFSADVGERLIRVYGSRAQKLIDLCNERTELAQPFNHGGDALTGEVVFSFQSESAKTLADCLLRRTMIGLNCDLAIGDDELAANVGKRFLGWSEQRARDEVSTYRKQVLRRFTDS